MEEFQKVCEEAAYRTRENPPGMEEVWENGVINDLFKAACTALEAGAPVDQVYYAVDQCRPEVEEFPGRLEHLLLEKGLHPDTMLPSGRSLLMHKLQGVYPPR